MDTDPRRRGGGGVSDIGNGQICTPRTDRDADSRDPNIQEKIDPWSI